MPSEIVCPRNILRLEKAQSCQEIVDCVDLYLSISPDVPVDRAYTIRFMTEAAKRQQFFRLIRLGEELVGWFLAKEIGLGHTQAKTFQQMYYMTNLTGVRAVKAVILAHEAIEDRACELGMEIVASTASHNDPAFVLTRILEKQGWTRRGYYAFKLLV